MNNHHETPIVQQARTLHRALTRELAHDYPTPTDRLLAFSYLLWPPTMDDPDAGQPARPKRRYTQAA